MLYDKNYTDAVATLYDLLDYQLAEFIHFSLFTTKKRYVTNEEAIICCTKDSKYLISNLIDTLSYYFTKEKHQNGDRLPDFVIDFINYCLNKFPHESKDKVHSNIVKMLEKIKERFETYVPFCTSISSNCSSNSKNLVEEVVLLN
jgi:hypothetical protein